MAIPAVQDDPDRLRTPMRRTPSGDFEPVSWSDALDLAADGRFSVAVRVDPSGSGTTEDRGGPFG